MKNTLLIKRVKTEEREETKKLNLFCSCVYRDKQILTGNGELIVIPDILFGAYYKQEIWGTIGITHKKKGEFLSVEKIFGLEFPGQTSEICRLATNTNLNLLRRIFALSSLILPIISYGQKERERQFVASVKPFVFSILKKTLGEDTFRKIDYDKINEEYVPEEQKVFYLKPPKPIIFSTNYKLAKKGGEKLRRDLNLLIKFI
ncbi:MAG: hypothetical protein Q8N21_03755 [bacterium]|nr:hypothetical protein [bacterium]